MGKREDEKRRSLDALGRLARGSAPPPPPKPAPTTVPSRPRPSTPAPPSPSPPPRSGVPIPPDTTRAKRAQQEARKAKLEEERAHKQRRSGEIARGSSLPWRGGGFTDIPSSIRRTGFDVKEPSVAQKIHDVLGDQREKEGRAKAKEKGKRQR